MPPHAWIRVAVRAQANELLLAVPIDVRRNMPVGCQSGGRLSFEVETGANGCCQRFQRREVATRAAASNTDNSEVKVVDL